MKNIASVVMSNCTREFDKKYHYIIPDELVGKVMPGIRVIVPFGRSNRAMEAFVFDIVNTTELGQLKEIKEIIDVQPVLTGEMMQLSEWMRERYICTCSDALKCMLPAGIGVKSSKMIKLLRVDDAKKDSIKKIFDELVAVDGECEYEELKNRVGIKNFSQCIKKLEEIGCISLFEEFFTRVKEKYVRVAFIDKLREEIIDEIESNRIRRIQQIRVLEMLLENEYISVTDLIRFSSVSASVLNTLKKYGYIDFKDIEVNREPLKNKRIIESSPLLPTPQQERVLNDIKEKLDQEKYHEVLLHGITGSGKTEVYLQLIQYCFDKGKQAIVLVPEISLTPQMVERFKGRFGEAVAVLHSRLSLGERYDQWRLIRDGKIKVVVGARSAVFAPFRQLGLIVIDEEHENSYKSETTPKYHARDIARERCRFHQAILVCGSATPAVENYFSAKSGNIHLLEMTERANHMLLPQVQLVDMRSELSDGNRSIFSKQLLEELERNIAAGQQSILFLNRRGYSSFVLCRKCGFTMTCANCNITLTYHAHDERLICHYCGYTVKNPETCPKCKSNYIKHFGAGTQRVEEEINKLFPHCSVIRMDIDTTSYKNSHEEILSNFREKNINIMVGTQMIAKGHDFPNVTLVGVLAADSLLGTGDYRASERTFQLITQVAGRAGRGEIPGRVVIQTYNTEDYSITSSCRQDYHAFYGQDIKIREKLCYPPFTNIGTIILSGTNDRAVFNSTKAVKDLLTGLFAELNTNVDILGPTRSPLSRIKNKYRWRIVIKCSNLHMLTGALTSLSDEFYRKRAQEGIELSLDINPVSMI